MYDGTFPVSHPAFRRYAWLGEGEDKVPPWGKTQVGCAGFVINDANELLVVKEWRQTPKGDDRVPAPQWKLFGPA